MYGNNREDIFNLVSLNLISNKLRVKIVGGGKAAYIKAKGLLEKGCLVHILAKEFSNDIFRLSKDNLILERGEYYKDFIENAHLIIIAVDDENLCREICDNCNEKYKMYINTSNFKEGMATIPYSKSYKNLSFSIGSKIGSPRIIRKIGKEIEEIVEKNDDYSILVGNIRERAKNEEQKNKIIDFISGELFKQSVLEGNFYDDLNKAFGEEVSKRLVSFKCD